MLMGIFWTYFIIPCTLPHQGLADTRTEAAQARCWKALMPAPSTAGSPGTAVAALAQDALEVFSRRGNGSKGEMLDQES